VKRVSATALACWVALSSVGAGAATGAMTTHTAVKAKKILVHYAPADEYFGPSKMSLLGIRNQLHDLSLQYDIDHDARNAIYGKAVVAETSLRDWAKKYTNDPALPRDVYLLGHLYGKIGLADGIKREASVQHWLLVKYPTTWYAKDEKKRIAYEKTHSHQVAVSSPSPVPVNSAMPTFTPVPANSATPQSSPVPASSAMPQSVRIP
jgi:hypothetical protein